MNTRLLILALTFFVMQSSIPLPGTALTNVSTDQSALLALKSQLTLDPSHVLSTNWSVTTSVCSWIGVTCGSRHQRVTALDISAMGLTGNLPPEMGNISFLMSFNLSGNEFRGNLPQEMSRLRRLQVIDFSVNNFTGELPSWFQYMAQLKSLNLRNNSFSGPLPNSITNISKLETLDLSFNPLQGEIPRGMGNAYSLKSVTLQYNQLKGLIPVDMFNISNLESLALSGNSLSGGLPDDLCRGIPWIQILALSSNELNGPIPSTISNCSRLRILSLSYNKFNGSIPREIGNLNVMELFYLGRNNITGDVPRSVGNLTRLTWFDVSYNNLIEAVPEEIGKLSSLEHLSLGFNSLSGSLSDKIFNISALQTIFVSHNQLSGTLPKFLGYGLTNLQNLDLGRNLFTGHISEYISNASNLDHIQLSDNSFSGDVPSSLGKLRFLQEFRLHRNKFIRQSRELTFITSLTNCTNLEVISLGGNPALNGTLPITIGNFSSSLTHLSFQESGLFGNIPNEICNLSSLILLALYGNQLTGPIPESLAKLKQLQAVGLSGNKLSGTIPNGVCEMTNLAELWLQQNQITGAIPDCIGKLTTLSYLHIGDNRLSSGIPVSLWKISDLLELNLYSNSLTGSIPPDVGNMKALLVLDLSTNQFSGNIPSSIGNLQKLKNLSLADNRFTGSIPEAMGNMLSLWRLNLSHNNLSGSIPSSLLSLRDLSYIDMSFVEGLCGDSRFGVPACPNTSHSGLKKRKVIIIVVCAFVGVTLFAVMPSLFIVAGYRRKKAIDTQTSAEIQTAPRRVSYYDIENSTEGFHERHLIGVGGFSSVYKGSLQDGEIVAIKVMNLQVSGACTNFDTECELLSSLRHRNLCKIIGVCSNESFKGLVLEYMPNGSLDKWLYSEDLFLNIMQRVCVMVDVACALEYLHHGYPVQVIHRDLKPGNILLDENMVAHLSDFGISKLLSDEDSIAQTKTLATFGYIAPEYGSDGLVSIKCDVYSYGITLMEVFTRMRPNSERFAGNSSLRGVVHDSWPNDIMRVIDSRLLRQDDQTLECLTSIMELGLNCSMENPRSRISMKDVVVKLRKIQMKLFTCSRN